jgi:hypothetical protein
MSRKEMATMEWRVLPIAPEYEVSEYGHVRRCVQRNNWVAGRHIKPKTGPKGHLCVEVAVAPWEKRAINVNRAVALAFHGDPPAPEYHAAHYDGDPLNNHYTNIRWATAKENEADKERHGRKVTWRKYPLAKLSDDDVARMKELRRSGMMHKDIAAMYGLHKSYVQHVIAGRVRKGA